MFPFYLASGRIFLKLTIASVVFLFSILPLSYTASARPDAVSFDQLGLLIPIDLAEGNGQVAIVHSDGLTAFLPSTTSDMSEGIDLVFNKAKLFRPPVESPRQASRDYRISVAADGAQAAIATPRSDSGERGSGQLFLFSTSDGTSNVWRKPTAVRKVRSNVSRIAFTGDGSHLIVTYREQQDKLEGEPNFDVFALPALEPVQSTSTALGSEFSHFYLSVVPDSSKFIVGARSNERSNASQVKSSLFFFSIEGTGDAKKVTLIDDNSIDGNIKAIDVSPSGAHVAVALGSQKNQSNVQCSLTGSELQLAIFGLINRSHFDPNDREPLLLSVGHHSVDYENASNHLWDVAWSESGDYLYAGGAIWRSLNPKTHLNDEKLGKMGAYGVGTSVLTFDDGNDHATQALFQWEVSDTISSCPNQWFPIGSGEIRDLVPLGRHGVLVASNEPSFTRIRKAQAPDSWAIDHFSSHSTDLRTNSESNRIAISKDGKQLYVESHETSSFNKFSLSATEKATDPPNFFSINLESLVIHSIKREEFLEKTNQKSIVNNSRYVIDTGDAPLEEHQFDAFLQKQTLYWGVGRNGLMVNARISDDTVARPSLFILDAKRNVVRENLSLFDEEALNDPMKRYDRYRAFYPLSNSPKAILGSFNFLHVIDIARDHDFITTTLPTKHRVIRLVATDVDDEGKLLLAAVHGDNIIRFYILENNTLTLIASLALKRDLSSWIIWLPNGLFHSKNGFEEALSVHGLSDKTSDSRSVLDFRNHLRCREVVENVFKYRNVSRAVYEAKNAATAFDGNVSDDCSILQAIPDDRAQINPKVIDKAIQSAIIHGSLKIITPRDGTVINTERVSEIKVAFPFDRMGELGVNVEEIELVIKGDLENSNRTRLTRSDVEEGIAAADLSIPQELLCGGASFIVEAFAIGTDDEIIQSVKPAKLLLKYNTAARPCSPKNIWAILIGENYEEFLELYNVGTDAIPPLSGAENDIFGVLVELCERVYDRQFSAVNLYSHGLSTTRLSLIKSVYPDCLNEEIVQSGVIDVRMMENHPDISNFIEDSPKNWLRKRISNANEDDIFVLYMAGHGYQSGEEIRFSTVRRFDNEIELYESTEADLDEVIEDIVELLPSRATLLAFVDACRRFTEAKNLTNRSTSGRARDIWLNAFKDNDRRRDMGALYLSTHADKLSFETRFSNTLVSEPLLNELNGWHGFFTWSVLEALGGGIGRDASSPAITRVKVSDYVNCRIDELLKEHQKYFAERGVDKPEQQIDSSLLAVEEDIHPIFVAEHVEALPWETKCR